MISLQYHGQFLVAARDGKIEEVKAMINAGFDVNITNDGRSALGLAARMNKWEMVKVLISAGANVNSVDGSGWTPLYYAARDGPTDIVQAFIDAGVDVNITNDGMSALGLAAWMNKWEMVKVLLSAGANVNIVNGQGWTPFFYAAIDGPTDIVQAFIDAGVDVNITNDGESALGLATWRNELEMVKVLISAGANTNFVDGNGRTPLFYAAIDGRTEIVQAFIDAGVDVNITNDGRSALGLATWRNEWEVVKVLINAGANVNLVNSEGWTPLFYAAKDGPVDVILLLIKAGANLNTFDQNGYNPINLVDQPERIDCSKVLITYAILKHGSIVLKYPIKPELSRFWSVCEKEIEIMRQKKLKCSVSIFEYLLETSENKLALYLSEENIDRECNFVHEKAKYLEDLSVYADDLKSQLDKGEERAYLLCKAMNCFSKKIPVDIKRKISELLTNDDLKNFSSCMKITSCSKIIFSHLSIFINDSKLSLYELADDSDVICQMSSQGCRKRKSEISCLSGSSEIDIKKNKKLYF